MSDERTRHEADLVVRTAPGRAILDLCCGYGRHVAELSRRAYDVVGLDLDLPILGETRSRLQQARVPARLVAADMRHLPFVAAFDAVINFWTSFGYLEGTGDFSTLQEVARVLRPDGVFILETVNREWALRRHQPREWWEAAGGFYLEERVLDLCGGRVETRALIIRNGQAREHRLSLRLYTCAELVQMLEAAGLHSEAVYGGPDGQPYELDAPRLVLVARKTL